MLDPNAVIDDFLSSHDLDYEQKDENTYLITLPGEAKQQTHCALVVGDHSLSINAFVIRKPDENKAAVFEYLLNKNASMYSIAFAVNELGDIYLVGRLPLDAVNEREIDRILGAVEHASHFGWEMTARKTLDVYDWALSKQAKSSLRLAEDA